MPMTDRTATAIAVLAGSTMIEGGIEFTLSSIVIDFNSSTAVAVVMLCCCCRVFHHPSTNHDSNNNVPVHFFFLIAALLVYSNSLKGELIYDDLTGIVMNADVDSSKTSVWDLFKHNSWGDVMKKELAEHEVHFLLFIISRIRRRI